MNKILGIIEWWGETLMIPLWLAGEWLEEHEAWLGR